MEEIQQRGTFAALQAEATQVRRDLHPSRIAARYVQMLA
jgi:hypothetical protein